MNYLPGGEQGRSISAMIFEDFLFSFLYVLLLIKGWGSIILPSCFQRYGSGVLTGALGSKTITIILRSYALAWRWRIDLDGAWEWKISVNSLISGLDFGSFQSGRFWAGDLHGLRRISCFLRLRMIV